MDELDQAEQFLEAETARVEHSPWWLWLLPIVSTLAGFLIGLKINH